jgi:hypothetical protein
MMKRSGAMSASTLFTKTKLMPHAVATMKSAAIASARFVTSWSSRQVSQRFRAAAARGF